MIQIIPGILATTDREYQRQIEEINKSVSLEGGWVQIDLMDHKFVANESIKPEVMVRYPTSLQIEAQLMVEYPNNWIDELVKLDVARIVFPVEDNENVVDLIKQIHQFGKQAGLSINPETPIDTIEPYVADLDVVLIMSVQPGFGGQEFIASSVDKVKEVARLRAENKLEFLIEVDGGISTDNAKDLVDAGADSLVIGAHRLIEEGIDETMEKIWETIQPTN